MENEKVFLSEFIKSLTERIKPLSKKRFDATNLMKDSYNAMVAKLSSDPKPPPNFQIEQIVDEAANIVKLGRSLSQLPSRKFDILIWGLFILFDNQPPFSDDHDAFLQFKSYKPDILSSSRRLRRIVKSFLKEYPIGSGLFDKWREMIEERLNRSSHLTLDEFWENHREKFYLNATSLHAKKWRSEYSANNEFLSDLSLPLDYNFVRQIELRILEEYEVNINEVSDKLELTQRLVDLLELEEKKLKNESHIEQIADALLQPWKEEDPPPDVLKLIMQFLLKHLGDPRSSNFSSERTPNKWLRVDEDTKQIMLRWLVKESLEQFFQVVREVAFDQHWKYREEFWRAYYELDVIEDAWVSFGPKALSHAKERNLQKDSYAELLSGASNHSVLLMRMGNLTIAEFSHNGKCNIFKDENPDKPVLYKGYYNVYMLRNSPDFVQIHHGSERGTWQQRVADYVRRETGIYLESWNYL